MHSNRHFNGRFQHAVRAGSICGLRVSIFDSHFPSFQIDTSGDLKSHLNHCKQGASLFPNRQSLGCIGFRFVSPHHHHPVDVDPVASNPPSRSSNLRSMLYLLYAREKRSHFAAGEVR
jgi:hypothetical protein